MQPIEIWTAPRSLRMMLTMLRAYFIFTGLLLASVPAAFSQDHSMLPGTKPLQESGDLSARMVAGIDKHLMELTEKSVAGREKFWKRDLSSLPAYEKSIQVNRDHLRTIIGATDPRVTNEVFEYISTAKRPAKLAENE